jgi:hypothetical protein
MTPTFVTEADLDRRYRTRQLLSSGGNYGCDCAVFDGSLDDAGDHALFSDEWLAELKGRHDGDIGTVLVTGDVTSKAALFVSDQLMCLVILGSVEAPVLAVFETEVNIGGDLRVGELRDADELVTVGGALHVREQG